MKYVSAVMFMVLVSLSLHSRAEDIDLFVGVPVVDPGYPNVLFILDNSSNWNSAFEGERLALQNVFDSLVPDPNDPNSPENTDLGIGLMMYGESPQMGYVRAAIRPMKSVWTDPNNPAVNRTYNLLYSDMIGAFENSGSLSDGTNNRTIARTFAEAHRYLTGGNSVNITANTGYGKNEKRDFFNNSGSKITSESEVIYTLPNNAFESSADYSYLQPDAGGVCAGTYIVYIGNNVPGGNVSTDSAASNEAARQDLEAAFPGAAQLITDGFTYTSHQGNWADEWAKVMHDELGIIFYAIDVSPTPHPKYDDGVEGQERGMSSSELLRSFSEYNGGGKYYRVSDPNDIDVTILEILSEIQAVNSVFASVALPAASTGNSVFLNQVFVGLFRPDSQAMPKWPGNLKQYHLGGPTDTIQLYDANDVPAINPTTGFVTDCARSFWTPTSADTYWDFDPRGICPPADNENPSESNSPDGPYVEKGAQAYVLRAEGYAERDIYTCAEDIASCTSMLGFTSANISISGIDPNDPNAPIPQTDLVDWVYGKDLLDENDDGDTTDTRAYVHGDVIHSRPIALNYGTDNDPEIVVFYGANDGMLRAVNGNQTDDLITDLGTYSPGQELWAFMPPEFWDKIPRLYTNTDEVKIPATGDGSLGRPGSPKDYGMDGPITAWEDVSAGTKYIYAAMRRGGRSLYAFDVSDPNDPPELLWKTGCQDGSCITAPDPNSWSDVGQTWSPANIAFVQGRSDPVLIMGGGYDDCEDSDNVLAGVNHTCIITTPVVSSTVNLNSTTTDTGDHIYVLDAVDGELLAVFDTERAVPGGVTIVTESDADQDIAFAYAADTGGNIYRLSGQDGLGNVTTIGSEADPSNWLLTLIGSFGCGDKADDNTCLSNRKFLYGPDVVRDLDTAYVYRILAGTGDREKPLVTYTSTTGVQNYFLSFLDTPLDPNGISVSGVCNQDVLCLDAMQEVDPNDVLAGGVAIDENTRGFALALRDTEQVVTSSLVVGDIANFSTHIPFDPNDAADDSSMCINNLGTATTYNIDFESAGGDLNSIFTGGLVPSPVAGLVRRCDDEGNCTEEPFCIGCGGENSPIGGSDASGAASFDQSKGRVYWNIQQ